MIRPVDADISQRFGDNPTRYLPASSWLIQTFGNYQPDGHSGEDYACPVGTPVRAVAGGTVLHIGWMGGTYDQNPWWIQPSFAGYHAVIDHGSFIGIYGHCQDGSAKVSKGDRVAEGQVFILSGNTGGSTGPHLHFEILPDQYVLQSAFYGRVDPEPFFAASLAYAGTVTTQSATQPKEWDDMASKDEIKDAIREVTKEGYGIVDSVWYRRINGWNGPVSAEARILGTDQAVNDIRALVAAQNAQIAGLVGALASVSKGESFDQAKLLEGVKAAAESGVKDAIESITVTVKG